MKQKLAYVLAAVAMLVTGAASMGSIWWMTDEPKAFSSLCN